jgi:hypothetical protein
MVHLQGKLRKRNPNKYKENKKLMDKKEPVESNPVFKVIKGDIEPWEKVKN